MVEAFAASIAVGLGLRILVAVTTVGYAQYVAGRLFSYMDINSFNTPKAWEEYLGRLPRKPPHRLAFLDLTQIRLRTLILVMQTAKTVCDASDGPARQNLIQIVHGPKLGGQNLECDENGIPTQLDELSVDDVRGEVRKTKATWVIDNLTSTGGKYIWYMVRELIIDCQAVGVLAPSVGFVRSGFQLVTTDSPTAKILELIMMRLYRQVACLLEAFRQEFLSTYPTLVDVPTALRLFERSYLWETHEVVARNDDANSNDSRLWPHRSDRYPAKVTRLSLNENGVEEERWATSYGALQNKFLTFQSQILRAARGTPIALGGDQRRGGLPFPVQTSLTKKSASSSEPDIYLACIKGLCKLGTISKLNAIKKHLLWKAPGLVAVAVDTVCLCLNRIMTNEQERSGLPTFMRSVDEIREDVRAALKLF